MTYDSLSISEVIPARPERIYSAWLSSDEHTAFTGDKAVIEPFVGGKHSSFDGYAIGQTVELQPGRRIVQTWRAEDFPLGSSDSRVEVTLEETVGGTMVTILHTEIPSGLGSNCRDGWLKYYLEPLKGYFVAEPRSNGVPTRAPRTKAAASVEVKAKAAGRTAAAKTRRKAKAKPRRAPKTKVRKRAQATKKTNARPTKKRVERTPSRKSSPKGSRKKKGPRKKKDSRKKK